MSDWKWILPPVSGPCACCREPLLKHRDGLVSWRQESYHLHCLLDQLTTEMPAPAPFVWSPNGII
jgi:hypothetical protein